MAQIIRPDPVALTKVGAFESDPWQSDSALHAALAMRRELASYNDEARAARPAAAGVGDRRASR